MEASSSEYGSAELDPGSHSMLYRNFRQVSSLPLRRNALLMISSSQLLDRSSPRFVHFPNALVMTSTHRLRPLISSSTVPPMPAPANESEQPTYTGFLAFLATAIAILFEKSRVDGCGSSDVVIGARVEEEPLI